MCEYFCYQLNLGVILILLVTFIITQLLSLISSIFSKGWLLENKIPLQTVDLFQTEVLCREKKLATSIILGLLHVFGIYLFDNCYNLCNECLQERRSIYN